MIKIQDRTFDSERALYGQRDACLVNCSFEGEADGESALKESGNIKLTSCGFSLRYPLWHCSGFSAENCRMDEGCRAPLWYSSDGSFDGCLLGGIKTLRECSNISFSDCDIKSDEFGWFCRDISLKSCKLDSVYCFLRSSGLRLDDVTFNGKYSFQYVTNAEISNSSLDTKDAFWHSENVTVTNSIIKGEYLGWYSKNLTLVNCLISGAQPLCYCEGLRLIDCKTENADLCFEYSDVCADICGSIVSVKNPLSGYINADSIGEIILADSKFECSCKINEK